MKQCIYLCMVATVVGCSLGITCAQTSDETIVTLPSASVLNKRLKKAKLDTMMDASQLVQQIAGIQTTPDNIANKVKATIKAYCASVYDNLEHHGKTPKRETRDMLEQSFYQQKYPQSIIEVFLKDHPQACDKAKKNFFKE